MEYLIASLFALAACGAAGGIIGSAKNAGPAGVVLGLVLGPMGVAAAFALDQRKKCPECHGRLNATPKICQHCQVDLQGAAMRDAPRDVATPDANNFALRCAKCKAELDLPLSAAGETVHCFECNKKSVAETFRA